MNDDYERLRSAVDALEAQRAALGDSVVEPLLDAARAKLAALDAATEPEQIRRQVSVLFLDVTGSTDLSRHLDPEEVHAVMDGLLARCAEVVHGNGGEVLQYAGDSLLAAFGARYTHDDDAERAVRCGLGLLEEGRALRRHVLSAHGHDGCDVRVGIHTGPVLLGGGVDKEGTIRGLTVNIAARMEQSAPAGGLRISNATWLLVRGLFAAQLQPPLTVKGHDGPLQTYLVQSALPRGFAGAARGVDGVDSPMIGREADLARLGALVDAVHDEPARPRMATIIGDPGIGKSRLVRELRAHLQAGRHGRLCVLTARAHPQSSLQPYGLLRNLLAWHLQIADSDDAETAKRKLETGLLATVADLGEAQAHRIGQLIGLDFSGSAHVRGLDPHSVRALGFSALTAFLRGLTRRATPAVLLLEDLHWADDASLDFIDEVLRDRSGVALGIVATARPLLLERRAGWDGDDDERRLRVMLSPLDGRWADALAHELTASLSDGAEPIRQLLTRQAEGNPFYMEELLRMLIDDGVIDQTTKPWRVLAERLQAFRLPTTLVDLLQARLATLAGSERRAIQHASVVGHVFWDDALAALSAPAPAELQALQAKSLVLSHCDSAFDGTVERAFQHHLLHQVTYDSVLKATRRAGHAAVARWLSQRVSGRTAEYLATTAEHYDRAGDHETALAYFERAADNAAKRYANSAALEYVRKALQSPALQDPQQRARLLSLQCSVADLAGQRDLQDAAMAALMQIADQLKDDHLRADVLSLRALRASRRGDEVAALELAAQTLPVATRAGNVLAASLCLGQMAFSSYSRGDAQASRHHAQQAIDLVRRAAAADPQPDLLSREMQLMVCLAQAEHLGGRLGCASDILVQALARAKSIANRRTQAHVLLQMAFIANDAGRPLQVIERLAPALDLATDIGMTATIAEIHEQWARALMELDDLEGAAERAASGNETAHSCGSQITQSRCWLIQGHLRAATEDRPGALAAYETALGGFESLQDVSHACLARSCMAMQLSRAGDSRRALQLIDEVAAALTRGLAIAVLPRPVEPWWNCYGVWKREGDPRARDALETAHQVIQAGIVSCDDADLRASMVQGVALHRLVERSWHEAAPETGAASAVGPQR